MSQGQHFEPVDGSGWLVGDASTLDPVLGYFLAQSWRMHSAVCGPVSRYSYGGRLVSEAITDARVLVGREPGVPNLFVEHDGNSTDSAEEAERIVAEILALLRTEWTDGKGSRPTGQGDVLVVAAYNAGENDSAPPCSLRLSPLLSPNRFTERAAPTWKRARYPYPDEMTECLIKLAKLADALYDGTERTID